MEPDCLQKKVLDTESWNSAGCQIESVEHTEARFLNLAGRTEYGKPNMDTPCPCPCPRRTGRQRHVKDQRNFLVFFKAFIASPRIQKLILNSYLPVDLDHTFRAGTRLRVQARCIQPLMQHRVCRSILEYSPSCNHPSTDRTMAVRIDPLTSPGSRS